jgi:hypothetical protein
VAIKKVKRVFEDLIDCKRILREIAILSRVDDPRVVKVGDRNNYYSVEIINSIEFDKA